jgi:hypothetical protein
MSDDQPGLESLYEPISVARTTMYDNDHKAIDGMRVMFKVVGAGDQYIDVPMDQFTPKKVETLMADHAMKIGQILSIVGPAVGVDEMGRPIPPGEVPPSS